MTTPRTRAAYALALVLACAFSQAHAHEIRPSVLDVTSGNESLTLRFRTNLEALLAGIPPGHDDSQQASEEPAYEKLRRLSAAGLAARAEAFLPQLQTATSLMAGNERLTMQVEDIEVPETGDIRLARDSILTFSAPVPPADTLLTIGWAEQFGTLIVRAGPDDSPESFNQYLQAGQTSDAFDLAVVQGTASAPARSAMTVFLDYIWIGIVHIIPRGADHILFVVGLFLLSPRLRPIVLQVTSFTLAHTVTLAFATLGWISVPAALVEPLIALSITLIAAENLFSRRLHKHRLVLVFVFGLLHGLGFAGVLSEAGLGEEHLLLSLLGFNAGVEAGQLCVVALCLLLVGWFRESPRYRHVVIVPISLAIGATGLYWFIERATG